MKILIAAEYLDDISNPATYNSRFLTVADLLVSRGHEVTLVTTDFIHSQKRHVSGVTHYNACPVITLHEPGYRKNISLRRFYSHHILGKRLKEWLRSAQKPDVIYCAVPSLDFAYEAAKFAKKNKIKFVLDIQDLWPEAFEMVLHIPVISHALFTPLRIRANYIYKAADRLLAVSQTYLDRALQVKPSGCPGEAVFLGTSLARFDSFGEEAFPLDKKKGELWLGYVGTLGYSYDLLTVFDAMKLLKGTQDYERVRFIVMGDGPLRTEFEKYAVQNELPVCFTGNLPYPTMVSGLSKCDIVVNPIKKGSAGSIINKHGDYASAGKPVINTQESHEYRRLIETYGMGINCPCGNAAAVADAMKTLLASGEMRSKMGAGARRCAEECFDRASTYKRIIRVIEN